VCAGPCPAEVWNSTKYCGTDKPIKSAKPTMKMFLGQFMLANWRLDIPIAAAYAHKRGVSAP
jgi:hypothetical protein